MQMNSWKTYHVLYPPVRAVILEGNGVLSGGALPTRNLILHRNTVLCKKSIQRSAAVLICIIIQYNIWKEGTISVEIYIMLGVIHAVLTEIYCRHIHKLTQKQKQTVNTTTGTDHTIQDIQIH